MYVLDTRYLANTSPFSLQSTYETMVILRKFLMVITLQVLTERANRKKDKKATQGFSNCGREALEGVEELRYLNDLLRLGQKLGILCKLAWGSA